MPRDPCASDEPRGPPMREGGRPASRTSIDRVRRQALSAAVRKYEELPTPERARVRKALQKLAVDVMRARRIGGKFIIMSIRSQEIRSTECAQAKACDE